MASMGTFALNSGLWVRRLLNSFGEGCAYGGSLFQGWGPDSEGKDGRCPEKPVHFAVQQATLLNNDCSLRSCLL